MKPLASSEYSTGNYKIISRPMLSVMQNILATVTKYNPAASLLDIHRYADKNIHISAKTVTVDAALRLLVNGKIIIKCPVLSVYYLPIYGTTPILSVYKLP